MAKNNRNSIGETVQYSRRAFGMWCKISPQYAAATVLGAVAKAILPYIVMYFTARLLNEIAGACNRQTLLRLLVILLAATAGTGALSAVINRWKNAFGMCDEYRLARCYYEKFLSMDYCVATDPQVNALYSQMRQNENWVGWGLWRVQSQLEDLTTALTQIIGAVALSASLFLLPVPGSGELVFLNSPVCVVVLLGCFLVTTVVAPVLYNRGQTYWSKVGEEALLGNRLFGFYNWAGFEERRQALDIRTYRQDLFFARAIQNVQDRLFTEKSTIAQFARGPMGRCHVLSVMVSHAFTCVIYLYVCLKAYGGAFGVGSVTQYIGAITALANGVAKLIQVFGDMKNNVFYLKTVFAFLDTPNRMYRGSLTTEKRADRNYQVEFRDVSFRYPGSGEYALRHVSMKFQVGQRLAVVGQNGSGKTTFIKLLCRLYDPTEGEILLNGIDIRKYRYEDYISIFSVVFQDFQLLAFPLGENIAGRRDYDAGLVRQCLERAGFGRRIDRMPEGLNTCLYKDFDKQGVEISGGEAQKIAIARALHKDAPFLILDEPTAALDPVTEAEIYAGLDAIVEDKTAIYISHRLSSCRFCDEIVVFDQGQIIQQGSHDVLLADTGGKYAQLWNAQAQYYV